MSCKVRLIFREKQQNRAGYSGGDAASVPAAFSFVFCIKCRKIGAFAPKKCSRSNRSISRAPHFRQNKKAIPYGMTFCFGGDKRDRTADLMTASCDRFVVWSVFASNTSVLSTKSTIFYSALRIVSTRFRTHLGHNPGQAVRD